MTNSKNSSNNSSESNELYAIAETSGQQFWFEVDRYYDIDRLNAKEKDKITLDKVLVLKDKESITIGKPYVKDAKIELEVVSHKRDKKILVYKMRPKKKTRRKMGHRQELTRVMVKSIKIGKSILVSDALLPANKDIILLSFLIIFDKSVFALLFFSSNGWPTNVFLIFSLSKYFFSKLNNNSTWSKNFLNFLTLPSLHNHTCGAT